MAKNNFRGKKKTCPRCGEAFGTTKGHRLCLSCRSIVRTQIRKRIKTDWAHLVPESFLKFIKTLKGGLSPSEYDTLRRIDKKHPRLLQQPLDSEVAGKIKLPPQPCERCGRALSVHRKINDGLCGQCRERVRKWYCSGDERADSYLERMHAQGIKPVWETAIEPGPPTLREPRRPDAVEERVVRCATFGDIAEWLRTLPPGQLERWAKQYNIKPEKAKIIWKS